MDENRSVNNNQSNSNNNNNAVDRPGINSNSIPYRCTLCNDIIDDIEIEIALNISARRKTNADTWEIIGNLNKETREVVCNSCFGKFVDGLTSTMSSIKKIN